MESNDNYQFTLFKGCTRVATWAGVPIAPLFIMFGIVAVVSMWISLWCYLLLLPAYVIMRAIAISDDKAFRIVGLYIETKLRNGNKKVWGSSSYSPIKYAKRRFME